MEHWPKVSVVVLSYNRLSDLRETVAVCEGYTYPNLERIVVDNCSVDGSGDYVRGLTEPFTPIVIGPKNLGSAQGHSVGMRAATGKYVIVMDDDAFVEDAAIYGMVRLFEAHGSLGVVSFNILNHSAEYESGKVRTYEREYSAQEIAESFNLFTESAAGFRKSVLEEVDYHQYEYFYYGEDTQLSLRILSAGHNIRITENLFAYHKISNVYRDNRMGEKNGIRNAIWMICQYFPERQVLPNLLNFLWLTAIAMVRKRQSAGVYFQAWHEAFGSLHKMLKRRHPLSKELFGKVLLPYKALF